MRQQRTLPGMRWMLLLAVVSGCAWTNQATVDAQRRASQPPPPDPLQEAMARVDKEIAEAHAREAEPTYVACRTSTTPECMTLVDTHRAYVSQLEDRQLKILTMLQERDFAARADRRERARIASQPIFPPKREMTCTQDPSYPGMPGQIHCQER